MDRQTKLDTLQKELSRKDLSFGCIFVDKCHWSNSYSLQYNIIIHLGEEYDGCRLAYYTPDFYKSLSTSIRMDYLYNETIEYHQTGKNEGELRYEILGHPVILSDVLVWLGNKEKWYYLTSYKIPYGCIKITILDNKNEISRDLTKPYLSEQSDTVVDGLYEVYLLTKKD